MDTTELHYLTYDPDEIWDEMIAAYVEQAAMCFIPAMRKNCSCAAYRQDNAGFCRCG
jgi:hypothetical protein